jgi:mycothiol synthase
VEIRLETPATRPEFEQWAAIMERVEGHVFEVDELAHVIETDDRSVWILAYLGAEAVGCGVGRPSSISGSLYAMARVLPECRRQGVGTALYAALSEHARSRGDSSLLGRIRENDAESRRFAVTRGFAEVSREYGVVLDVADVDASGEPLPAIELVTLAERPDLEPAVYELDSEVAPDVPRPEGEDHEQWTLDRWHEVYLEGPGAAPETCVIALVQAEVVGYTGLRRHGASSPDATNLLTAVRREWRQQGIATALKREQAVQARKLGIERIYTTNDETNVGMRGVNARLGYRPAPTYILVSGPLAA